MSERYEQASEWMSEWFSILRADFLEKENDGERESETGRDKARDRVTRSNGQRVR